MAAFHRHLPRKVEFARDALVACITDRDLHKGDRLPSYTQLRGEFGLGSQTIAAAVGSLCELGILEVHDKVGIFVKNPPAGRLTGRTVAVAIRRLSGSAYAATLAGFIQMLLNSRNCSCLTFFQNSDPALVPSPGLEEFPGLEMAVAEHRCDGLISFCPLNAEAQRLLKRFGVQSCFVGDNDQNNMANAVMIETDLFIAEAAAALVESGCRRIVQLCISREQLAKRDCGIPGFIASGYPGGAEVARKLLAMPPAERPDGIVCDDDTIVSGLLAELLCRETPNITYLPQIATIVHRELGESYPSTNMVLFEQSIEEYALLAVDLLMNILQGKAPENSLITYHFNRIRTILNKGEKENGV